MVWCAGTQNPATFNQADPEMPAVVMFTSGTSGYPKGAVISHANLNHACRAVAKYLDYHTHHSAAVVLPLHYSYALLSQVCCQLTVGGFVYLFDSLRNPVKVAERATAEGLATFCGSPLDIPRAGNGPPHGTHFVPQRSRCLLGGGGNGPRLVFDHQGNLPQQHALQQLRHDRGSAEDILHR